MEYHFLPLQLVAQMEKVQQSPLSIVFIESQNIEWVVALHLTSLATTSAITINGEIVNDSVIIKAFEAIEKKREGVSLTYFEFSTLAALIIFSEADVDIALLEVGLGGRLDSINVVDSDVSVITNVAIDHTEYLGDTRESIGTEKAGIMRTAKPCICGDQDPPNSLLAFAKKINVPLTLVKEKYEGEIGLEGDHQKLNAAVAIKVIEAISDEFPVSKEMIKIGIKQAQIVARFEKVNVGNKTVILDVAHNPAAVQTLSTHYLTQRWKRWLFFPHWLIKISMK